MIGIRTRQNLFYPLMLFIFSLLREIDSILIERIGFSGSLLLTYIMFFAEFVAGLLLFLYHLSFLGGKKEVKILGIKLIQGNKNMNRPDKTFKIYFLIFMAAYFDFIEFMITTIYISKYYCDASKTLYIRQRCIMTLFTAFFCFYLLKFEIHRHQVLSLLIIFGCLIGIIISEYFFEEIPSNPIELTTLIFVIFIDYFFNSFIELIDKYLLEFDYVNPFQILMLEGIFGLLFCTIYSFNENPLKALKIFKKENLPFLIIYLFLFFLFSCGRNSYRITTNKLFSPMTRALTDSVLDPFLVIYYYISGEDFNMKGKKKIIYFFINFFLLIIIVICGAIYNEFMVLYCCKMEYDTYSEISIRAINDKSLELLGTEKNDDDSDSD